MIALRWPCPGILPKLRTKVAESPHRTSPHQKHMHHKSQGMTENNLENVVISHP
jgi:hypothetical protein